VKPRSVAGELDQQVQPDAAEASDCALKATARGHVDVKLADTATGR
jgi:hypothetical protein